MDAHPKKSWVLPDEQAAAVQGLIEAGVIRGLEDIVAEGLAAFSATVPEWDVETLRKALRPALAELERDPSSAIPLDEAWAEIEADIARRRGEG